MRRISLPERPNWRAAAKDVGFGFHEMYGEPYWLDDAAYVFTLDQIEHDIEEPTRDLHDMCMDLVAEVVESEPLLERMEIPRSSWDLVRNSWTAGDRHLYGRFDYAYAGKSPAKLLEYNADTPTSVFETAYFQHNWLMDQIDLGILPKETDQFNYLQESLIEAFSSYGKRSIFHFACWTESSEDRGTATYLMDCAVQAGHRTVLLDIQEIGVDAQGRFTDKQDRVIDRCFKLYPWEDMLRESFAKRLQPGVFVEPAWKCVLSNKAILPLLWQRHANHPNLLPSFFEDDANSGTLSSFVVKPFFSREGGNIEIFMGTGVATEQTDGDYAHYPRIVQGYTPLFETDGRHAVLGSWVVGDRACGLGVREDTSLITRDLSRFVPHIIGDNPTTLANR